jgi:phosphatidylserine/phosphatidylglycerophosphate/cardiolipin synthase-like enzyme/uncharacterized membrane protein YdjX (TVP38/TMEM64 family)
VLVDAADYFTALRSSLLAARRSILILGWELHSRTRLEGTRRPRDGAPAELGALLRWLLRHRPGLEIRILLWNHPTLYAIQRELFPRFIFGHRKLERVEIRLDNHLPLGACHHEKLVVVDDNVAYCGGIDLTLRRWDTSAHHPAEPRRRLDNREPYVPMHDVQMLVDGEAAAALGERARERWLHAGAAELPPLRPGGDAWPPGVRADFENVEIGIVRTAAALEETCKDVREVEHSTVAALSQAERLVYIENQYITSKSACEALRSRMLANPKLEAIVVTTRELGGWLEAEVMGVGRQQFMAAFAEEPLAGRIHFVSPVATGPAVRAKGGEPYSIHVHAKVLIVDDRFLRVGSSNLNNRSMGFDTECDLAIEASTAAQRRSIAAVRARLVAEHWGSDAESAAHALAERRNVWAALEALPRVPVYSTAQSTRYRRLAPWRRAERAHAQRSVVPLPVTETSASAGLVLQLGDPERALSPEQLIAQAVGVKRPRRLLRLSAGLLAATVVVALLVALDRAGIGVLDLGSKLVDGIGALGQSSWGIPLVVAAFVVGSLIAVPILALIGATVIALGPVLGFVCSAAGTLLAATVTFGVGKLIGRQPLQSWLGSRLESLERRFTNRGIIAVALIRKVPFAPFTIVNMLIGAIGIRYRDFLLGTSLGMLPGIAAFAFVSDRALDAWREPTPRNLALIAGALLLWLGVVLGVQQLANRRTR